jgi:wobble nucleotide-excising tRNase
VPKPMCKKCNIAFRRESTEVRVIETFLEDNRPYKIWNADLFECPKCGTEIVADFANKPLACHHDDNFKQVLEATLGLVHYWLYEK